MSEITIRGTSFLLDGRPFEYTGISFFNAIYNEAFGGASADRRRRLERFRAYGINALRIWAQWDCTLGFADTGKDSTLYQPDGTLKQGVLDRIKAIASDMDAAGMVMELVLFARESWDDHIRLDDAGHERAAIAVANELRPHRNILFQIWNEHDYRAIELAKAIKQTDSARLVSNSPGWAGILGTQEHNTAMDYLSPHTSRQYAGRTWEVAPREIAYLLARYAKPVVDDEPARNGTHNFGGPAEPTSPLDHILHTYGIWQAGGYVTYHHDMFQLGYGSPSCPPDGVPDPEFSPYHRQVFEFLAKADRFRPARSA